MYRSLNPRAWIGVEGGECEANDLETRRWSCFAVRDRNLLTLER